MIVDIVDDLLTRMRTAVAGLPDDAVRLVEASIRQEWGGTEPYIRKHTRQARGGPPARLRPELGPAERAAVLATGLRAGKPIAELFREAGYSKTRGFCALAKRLKGMPRAKRP